MQMTLWRGFFVALGLGAGVLLPPLALAQDGTTALPDAVSMQQAFLDPPAEARPRTWWHWMNGNVTKEGIAKDLAWLKKVGIGGVQAFDASLNTPQVVEERLVFMTPKWKDAFRFADSEAERLGLELAIASSPGWSHSGGPWVPPSDAMKKLVWSETRLAGGKPFKGQLTALPRATGPFQSVGLFDPLHPPKTTPPQLSSGAAIAVLAVPVAAPLPIPRYELEDGFVLDHVRLNDADLDSGVSIPLAEDKSGAVVVRFDQAQTVRSLRVFLPRLRNVFRGMPIQGVLEVRHGDTWHPLSAVPLSAVPTTISFGAVTAEAFRLRFVATPETDMSSFQGAAGSIDIPVYNAPVLRDVLLSDLRFSGDDQTARVEEKAGYQTVLDYHEIANRDSDAASISDLSEVIDLTDKVSSDGRLDWTPPDGGHWRILSFGWSLTGKSNHPAPPEATGLEVDKFDSSAVRRYFEAYLAMYQDTGATGLDAILTDSIEVGMANWTPHMEAEFEARRGYRLRPWLPALTGVVIHSPARTERFLFDWRQTLSELLTDGLYRTLADVAHERGLKVYGEALEDKRPMLGDDLAMRSFADIPMAALWTWQKGNSVRSTLIGDIRGAASVAHVYGKPIVAAESMTAVNTPWGFAPPDLRPFIDTAFVNGVNRPVIHTSVHQPLDDRQPGLSLLIFGQYFNRHETWADMAGAWVDYMARTGYMLQQGVYHADVAIFTGEDIPVTAQFASSVPSELPTANAYDFVNAKMLTDALRVENGEIVSLGGTHYRALYLGKHARWMTFPTLRRISKLAGAGATIIGERPEGTPSLADDADEFAKLAAAVWSLPSVIDTTDLTLGLKHATIAPDFTFSGGSADSDIPFLHRRLSDGGSVYYIVNRRDQTETVEARFRVTGLVPEYWDAVSGTARPLSFRADGAFTLVSLKLEAHESGFVVFRKPADRRIRMVPDTKWEVVGQFEGPWHVSFQQGRGAPKSLALPELSPLNANENFGVRHFSGVATYTTSFRSPAALHRSVWLDLGQIGDVAQVFVNGEPAGTSWWKPYRIDISRHLRRGNNTLEIRVANLWVNRLIGDQEHGADKITFTTAPTYKPGTPLRPAGLIGPVTLLTTKR
ncbi:glycosyl hydrolase [Sphingorhabdus sp.]|uniref:glycosyl hydrolase n=1 Tax=Sphingorhabdus sp. TaxID=1902408 RepID=UPI00391C274E